MHRISFPLLFILFSLSVNARRVISGTVSNCLTGEPVSGVTVQLLSKDSTVLKTDFTHFTNNNATAKYRLPHDNNGEYILKFSKLGFHTQYKNININLSKRITEYPVDNICLQEEAKVLDEVTVKATKIKMVMRGDTIIYNADAFHLSEGSMLDALVSQLPGTKLTDDGRIYVNGKYVQSLIVNGRDFFKGNPKVALENLPAYTVNKIKVYDQAGEISRLTGRKLKDDMSYVMDVVLKKEYATGWTVNADMAAGTRERYLARLFALRFTTLTHLATFCNVNNVNDGRRPGRSGDWNPAEMPDGLMSTRMAGMTFNYESKKHDFVFSSDVTASHTDADSQTKTSSQTYLSTGDTYRKMMSRATDKCTSINYKSELTWRRRGISSRGNILFDYQKNDLSSFSRSGTFVANPSLSYDIIDTLFADVNSSYVKDIGLNRLRLVSDLSNEDFNMQAGIKENISIKGDILHLEGSMKYKNEDQHNIDVYQLDYLKTSSRDYRNNYITRDHRETDLNFKGFYDYFLGGDMVNNYLELNYTFDYSHDNVNNPLYRLDWLGDSVYTVLPSTVDYMNKAIDPDNTYNSVENKYQHSLNFMGRYLLYLHKRGHSLSFTLAMPAKIVRRDINYFRKKEYSTAKNNVFFEPSFFFGHNVYKRDVMISSFFSISCHSELPSMIQLIDVTDDSNPLLITKGNTHLKPIRITEMRVSSSESRNKHQQHFNIGASYTLMDNALAYSYMFNDKTGSMTTMPINVNGNWKMEASAEYGRTIDSKSNLSFTNRLSGTYFHNVDMTGTQGQNSVRNVVLSRGLTDDLKMDCKINGNFSVGMKGACRYHNISSNGNNSDATNAFDFNYGGSLTAEFPWHIQFNTTLMMYGHRGYLNHVMNNDDLIWNAQLSKSVMKGKMSFILDGYDILGQMSNKHYVIDSQGRTETITNAIPRYVMLHVSYKFSKTPKKK